jgi:acetate kinase
METMKNSILTINSGTSTIKFSLYETGIPLTQLLYGEINSIGTKETKFHCTDSFTQQKQSVEMDYGDQGDAADFLILWLEEQHIFDCVKVTGHRLAHTRNYKEPELVTPALLDDLKRTDPGNSKNLFNEIALIEIFGKRYPAVVQIACFDISFFTIVPFFPKLFPELQLYNESALQCYGFHSLSFEYLLEEIDLLAGSKAADGKIILLHLGQRKSMAAFKNGESIDSLIDFASAEELSGSNRNEAWSLRHTEKDSAGEYEHLFSRRSVSPDTSQNDSGVSGSMYPGLNGEDKEKEMESFCYETRKWIGSFAAEMGGLDTLVFAGGLGEHAPEVRSQICDSLGFLGIELDEIKNMNNDRIVSIATSPVTVRIIKSNEELMIARLVYNMLNY